MTKFIPGSLVFKMYAERGLPPEITMMLSHDNGCVVEWPSFISEAIRNGWTPRKTLTTITTAAKESDVFNESQLSEFNDMAKQYFSFTFGS